MCALHGRLPSDNMTIIRVNPQKKYQLINEFGLDYAKDVLEISDPTSGIFDDDIKGETINILKEQIEELEISISEREYELQGVIPNSCHVCRRVNRYQQEKVYECSDITQ